MELTRKLAVEGRFRLATALNTLPDKQPSQRTSKKSPKFVFSLEVPGGAVETHLVQNEDSDDLTLKILGDLATEETVELIESTIRRMFSLDINPEYFFKTTTQEAHLRFALSIHPELRLTLYSTPYQAAVHLFLMDFFPGKESYQVLANLREVCGVVPAGRLYSPPAFPGENDFIGSS